MNTRDIAAALNATDARGLATIRFVTRGQDRHCSCCGKPLRVFPVFVLLTADTAPARGPRPGLGGIIGHCCDRPEPALVARVIDVLNNSIAGERPRIEGARSQPGSSTSRDRPEPRRGLPRR